MSAIPSALASRTTAPSVARPPPPSLHHRTMSSQIAALRLPGLQPRDLTCVADADAESPVDVRALPPSTPLTPDTGVRTNLELPPMHTHAHALPPPPPAPSSTAPSSQPVSLSVPGARRDVPVSVSVSTAAAVSSQQLSQNEIKKAQNRKSAKRFREAQKRRWQKLQDELISHKRVIDELRAELADRDAHSHSLPAAKRSAMSINALVEGAPPSATSVPTSTSPSTNAHHPSSSSSSLPSATDPAASHPPDADAEAALYAQLLSSAAQLRPHAPPQRPYVADLGVLDRCLVVTVGGMVVGTRRGTPMAVGASIMQGVQEADSVALRNALTCGHAVAVGYARHGTSLNAVVKPVPASTHLLLAEFIPFAKAI